MKFCYMYLRTVSVLLLCLGSLLSVSAQRKAPGYMGKRFLLKYDQGISWSLGGDARGIPNLFYTLQGDLAVTTKWSIGAEYSFMTRKYAKNLGTLSNYYYGDYDYYGDQYRLNRTFMHRVGLYGKMFSQRNGHIAPAGPYFLLGLDLHFVQGQFRVFPEEYPNAVARNQNKLAFDFAPTIGGGKQYIIANRMVVSVDLRISIPLIGLASTFNNEVGVGMGKTETQQMNRKLTQWTLWPNTQANFIQLRVGLGTLL